MTGIPDPAHTSAPRLTLTIVFILTRPAHHDGDLAAPAQGEKGRLPDAGATVRALSKYIEPVFCRSHRSSILHNHTIRHGMTEVKW